MTKFAVVQITSTNDYNKNLEKVFRFIRSASENGAKVVSLPEVFTFIGNLKEEGYKYAQDLNSILINDLAKLAKELKIYLLAGSFTEKIENSEKFYNTSVFLSPSGEIKNIYRKIHLFDANLPGPERYKESDNFEAGELEQLEVIETEFGKMAFTICYDLRFPEIYRVLATKKAEIIFVPAAFTMHTGKDHWEILLRARAIENQVYIVAPNQFGFHNEKRESYGNSMIIDPWGKVISRASDREEVIYADLDLEYLYKIRTKLSCLEHRKL